MVEGNLTALGIWILRKLLASTPLTKLLCTGLPGSNK